MCRAFVLANGPLWSIRLNAQKNKKWSRPYEMKNGVDIEIELKDKGLVCQIFMEVELLV